jgi:hypothetical protein
MMQYWRKLIFFQCLTNFPDTNSYLCMIRNTILSIQHLPEKLIYGSTLSIQNHRLYLSWEPLLTFAFFILPCSWIYVRAPEICCLQPRTFNISKLTKVHLAIFNFVLLLFKSRIGKEIYNNGDRKEGTYFQR